VVEFLKCRLYVAEKLEVDARKRDLDRYIREGFMREELKLALGYFRDLKQAEKDRETAKPTSQADQTEIRGTSRKRSDDGLSSEERRRLPEFFRIRASQSTGARRFDWLERWGKWAGQKKLPSYIKADLKKFCGDFKEGELAADQDLRPYTWTDKKRDVEEFLAQKKQEAAANTRDWNKWSAHSQTWEKAQTVAQEWAEEFDKFKRDKSIRLERAQRSGRNQAKPTPRLEKTATRSQLQSPASSLTRNLQQFTMAEAVHVSTSDEDQLSAVVENMLQERWKNALLARDRSESNRITDIVQEFMEIRSAFNRASSGILSELELNQRIRNPMLRLALRTYQSQAARRGAAREFWEDMRSHFLLESDPPGTAMVPPPPGFSRSFTSASEGVFYTDSERSTGSRPVRRGNLPPEFASTGAVEPSIPMRWFPASDTLVARHSPLPPSDGGSAGFRSMPPRGSNPAPTDSDSTMGRRQRPKQRKASLKRRSGQSQGKDEEGSRDRPKRQKSEESRKNEEDRCNLLADKEREEQTSSERFLNQYKDIGRAIQCDPPRGRTDMVSSDTWQLDTQIDNDVNITEWIRALGNDRPQGLDNIRINKLWKLFLLKKLTIVYPGWKKIPQRWVDILSSDDNEYIATTIDSFGSDPMIEQKEDIGEWLKSSKIKDVVNTWAEKIDIADYDLSCQTDKPVTVDVPSLRNMDGWLFKVFEFLRNQLILTLDHLRFKLLAKTLKENRSLEDEDEEVMHIRSCWHLIFTDREIKIPKGELGSRAKTLTITITNPEQLEKFFVRHVISGFVEGADIIFSKGFIARHGNRMITAIITHLRLLDSKGIWFWYWTPEPPGSGERVIHTHLVAKLNDLVRINKDLEDWAAFSNLSPRDASNDKSFEESKLFIQKSWQVDKSRLSPTLGKLTIDDEQSGESNGAPNPNEDEGKIQSSPPLLEHRDARLWTADGRPRDWSEVVDEEMAEKAKKKSDAAEATTEADESSDSIKEIAVVKTQPKLDKKATERIISKSLGTKPGKKGNPTSTKKKEVVPQGLGDAPGPEESPNSKGAREKVRVIDFDRFPWYTLSEQLGTKPDKKELKSRCFETIRAIADKIFNSEDHVATIIPVGTSAHGLGLGDSNLDIAITHVTGEPVDFGEEKVKKLMQKLKGCGIFTPSEEGRINKYQKPIYTFDGVMEYAHHARMKVKIIIGDKDAGKWASLLTKYGKLFPVRAASRALKKWAEMHNCIDKEGKMLTPNALWIMVIRAAIYYGQVPNPPTLEELEEGQGIAEAVPMVVETQTPRAEMAARCVVESFFRLYAVSGKSSFTERIITLSGNTGEELGKRPPRQGEDTFTYIRKVDKPMIVVEPFSGKNMQEHCTGEQVPGFLSFEGKMVRRKMLQNQEEFGPEVLSLKTNGSGIVDCLIWDPPEFSAGDFRKSSKIKAKAQTLNNKRCQLGLEPIDCSHMWDAKSPKSDK
jgi:hypothetical protein